MSHPATFASTWKRVPALTKANAFALLFLGTAFCALLWTEWVHDPDLSHGFFMPVIFFYALFESRSGVRRYLQPQSWPLAAFAAFTCVGVVATAGLYAAAVGWSNALVTFLLAVGFSLLCLSVLANLATQGVELFPFNWSSVVACGLWILCAPIPPGSYSRLSLALQLWVSGSVLHTLHLLGIAAHQRGNIIELANASVGIEDACSGIRSLVSCVFAAFFFSAVLVRGKGARTFIILLSVPLALAMNFLRALLLTLLTNKGVRIEGFWHDATGYCVLLVTAGILGGLAFALAETGRPDDAAAQTLESRTPAVTLTQLSAALAALGAVVLVGFFYHNTRPASRHDTPPPDLYALLPGTETGWKVITRDDLYQFEGTLRTDHLAERSYMRSVPGGVEQITLYVAYWAPGQAPVSLVAMHTPDACWPGTGWVAQQTAFKQEHPPLKGATLPNAEYRLFTNQGFPQYVWFWHLYDGRPIPFQNPYSAAALLGIAWNYGFRHDGDQLFVRVSSNRPWAEFKDEPMISTFFARVHALGL